MKTLFISSNDCSDLYPNNSPTDFIIELPNVLELHEPCVIVLNELEISGDFQKNGIKELYILCDICESSFVNNGMHPVLRRITTSKIKGTVLIKEYERPIEVVIKEKRISRLRIYLTDGDMKTPSFISKPLKCTLTIKRLD